MPRREFKLSDSVLSRFPELVIWSRPCTPRILMIVDGLTWSTDGFGLTRFLEAITIAAGVTKKPALTLASRFGHFPDSVTVGADSYTISENFRFDTANPAVTLANYDQIWLFGIASGAFYLSDAEVGVIATFMNGGGGVFATGDHERLGLGLCGELPRVRHMRDWSSIPMGLEADANVAVNRIDTVVDPGANGLYEFDDQSDEIPQRIYPNYQVTDTDMLSGTGWEAKIHPLLMLPGAATPRTNASGFTNDIDVLPDHPHESVCIETPAGVLANPYDLSGQNFTEYQPLAVDPTQRVKAEVVAFGVSGGRAVDVGASKPPVRPRMFPIITAYDGRLAQPYPGNTQRPGRIVCDSTWHHFVNINLDGTDSPHTGLGSFDMGGNFIPGPQLLKIYAYYRNIVQWLQPANRVWCRWWWYLVALRYHPILIEELIVAERLTAWSSQVALGRTAAQLLDLDEGPRALDELIGGLLLNDDAAAPLGDLFNTRRLRAADIDPDELKFGILGGSLVRIAQQLPLSDRKEAQAVLKRGVEKNVKELAADVTRLAGVALSEQVRRADRKLTLLRDQRFSKLVARPR